MKPHSCLIGLGLALSLAACVPAAQYTDAEAPKALRVDNASTVYAVRFYPGSPRLVPADAARLRGMAATGKIGPSDRVTVAAAGGAQLAAARFQAIAHELVAYRVVPSELPLAAVPRDRALIDTGSYLVTLPPCPNWGKYPALGFTNTGASNFGCADAVNLGRMVWRPADLAEGVPLGPTYVQAVTTQYPSDVFTPGAAVPSGGVYAASPATIASAINVLGCAQPLPSASSSVSASGPGVTAGSSGVASTTTTVACTAPAAKPPY
jgi:type IV pilus biogenesis protein CpaD/CtpE